MLFHKHTPSPNYGIHRIPLYALACLGLLALAPTSHAQDKLLEDQWWSEPAHGLMLHPPVGAERIDNTADGALAVFKHPAGYRLSVFIYTDEMAIDFKHLKNRAFDKFSYAFPTSSVLQTVISPPPRKKGAAVMVAAEDDDGKPFRWGQVFIGIDDFTFAVIQLDANPDAYDQAVATIEQMLASLKIMDLGELRNLRAEQMLIGQTWLNEIVKGETQVTVPREMWFRVIEKGEDIGYRRVRFVTDEAELKGDNLGPGVAVKDQMRLVANRRVFDVAINAYKADAEAFEAWEARTTLRKQMAGTERTATWVDTGFRTGDTLQTTRDKPSQWGAVQDNAAQPGVPKTSRWPTPPVAYLAQTDLYRFLPFWHTLPQDACFYSYDINTGELAQRLISVNEQADGGKLVTVRPTPSSGLQRLEYDAEGNLRRHVMADGRIFIPTTADQIAVLWNVTR